MSTAIVSSDLETNGDSYIGITSEKATYSANPKLLGWTHMVRQHFIPRKAKCSGCITAENI